ncbi:MAG: hypothetical protein JWL70_2228 [Acidimicrobiia bacterium]|nr:hypothetical protein [Acidimicrobiia bacterium]
MNAWFVAAIVLILGMLPLWVVLLRADTVSRLVALETAGITASLTFICLAQAFDRSFYTDIALLTALMSMIGGLTFARLLERVL